MDLGATLCTRNNPRCEDCPLQMDCIAKADGTQADFPAKKPKKVIPEKQAVMLIIKNEHDEVMMIKRPPTGIWGGLWCFPQFDTEVDANEWFASFATDKFNHASKDTLLSHTFSHFKLHIQPLIITLKHPINSSVMENHETLWYNVNTEFDGGLAAPVTTLLNRLRK